MKARQYRRLCRRLKGENNLIQLLRQIATCKDQEPARSLANHLTSNHPVIDFFTDEGAVIDGQGLRDAYLDIEIHPQKLTISFGICYGGEAGEGAGYNFHKKNDQWILSEKPEGLQWLH